MKKFSVEQILSMDMNDLMKLNAEETKQAANVLASAANKRIRRLIKAPTTYGYKGKGQNLAYQSPAVRGLYQKVGGKNIIKMFSTDKKQLGITSTAMAKGKYLKELSRAKRFLEAKTSTAKGVKELAEKVSGKGLYFKTKAAESKFWKLYTKVLAQNRSIVAKKGEEGRTMSTDMLVKELYSRVFGGRSATASNMAKTKTIMDEMQKFLGVEYEQQQKAKKQKPTIRVKSESFTAKDIFGDDFE